MGQVENYSPQRFADGGLVKGIDTDSPVSVADAQVGSVNALRAIQNAQQNLDWINVYRPLGYNASQQQRLVNDIRQQGGLSNQSQVFNQQQALANQLQGVAQGTGPNPAQAQLAQATGQNVANQAALMASQRGATANPALLARLAAQQGASIQQQAAGQAATLQAQQSLAALGQLQGQQQNMGSLATQQAQQQIGATQAFGQQQQGFDALGLQRDSVILQKQQLQQALAGLSLQQEQNLLNQISAQSATKAGLQANINTNQAGIAQSQNQMTGQVLGGLAQGAAGAASSFIGGVKGGGATSKLDRPPEFAEGGEVAMPPRPRMPSHLEQMAALYYPQAAFANGGAVHAMLSGGHVPGKAKVAGDSPKNDTVKALLSPGEVVIPRSVMQSEDPPEAAEAFVKAVMSKKQKDPKALESEFKLALKDAMSKRGKKK